MHIYDPKQKIRQKEMKGYRLEPKLFKERLYFCLNNDNLFLLMMVDIFLYHYKDNII